MLTPTLLKTAAIFTIVMASGPSLPRVDIRRTCIAVAGGDGIEKCVADETYASWLVAHLYRVWISAAPVSLSRVETDLRRTMRAIVWRHANGAKWRSVELGPWWRAAQIRWSKLGVWSRLLEVCQERGVSLGMAFLDGTVIRAHHKAAGAKKKGACSR